MTYLRTLAVLFTIAAIGLAIWLLLREPYSAKDLIQVPEDFELNSYQSVDRD